MTKLLKQFNNLAFLKESKLTTLTRQTGISPWLQELSLDSIVQSGSTMNIFVDKCAFHIIKDYLNLSPHDRLTELRNITQNYFEKFCIMYGILNNFIVHGVELRYSVETYDLRVKFSHPEVITATFLYEAIPVSVRKELLCLDYTSK